MTTKFRRQLTLFVERQNAGIIEKIRQQYNPIQYSLIDSHVTLCREDEIENIEQIIANLKCLKKMEIIIKFKKATRFENGKGVFLPAELENREFDDLRKQILYGIDDNPKRQEPHITLMHPRNSTCTDKIFNEIKKMNLPTKLDFKTISLIEQFNGGKWNVLQDFRIDFTQ